jgi:putative hydrolase of the HAD superfamily
MWWQRIGSVEALSMTIKVLMVDVDGVIVVHPHPLGWSAHLERDLGLARNTLQAAFFEPHFNEVVHGRAPLRERLEPVLREIAPHLTCDQLIEYWFAHDSSLNLDLLQQLGEARRRGLKLHLATVQEHERADFLWRKLGLSEQFDAIHYAADLGWAKPAQEFFAAVERRSGFAAEEIFFLDDKIENVEAARKRGWRAVLWTGENTLEELLKGAGQSAAVA